MENSKISDARKQTRKHARKQAWKQVREFKKKLKSDDIAWSKLIKARAFYKCEICGSSAQLNSHHIIPREFKPARHDWMNGVCLCILHHKFSLDISPHRNSWAFYTWLQHTRPHILSHLELYYGNI